MAALDDASVTLRAAASRLETANPIRETASLATSDQIALDDLFAEYTMVRERTVHREFLQRFGLTCKTAASQLHKDRADDDVLLF